MRIPVESLEHSVLQRDANGFCRSFIVFDDVPAFAEVQVFFTSCGGKLLPAGSSFADASGQGKVRLSTLPSGGPYDLQAVCGTETICIADVCVGDVWLLAGQSNMCGSGKLSEAPAGIDNVRCFGFDRRWRIAAGKMHNIPAAREKAYDHIHQLDAQIAPEKDNSAGLGIGPGQRFGGRMLELTGVPQGLICGAIGASSLDDWNWEYKKSDKDICYYGALLEKFQLCGGSCRGLFWYQGEADAVQERIEAYFTKTSRLLDEFRKDFGNGENFDIVIAQLSIIVLPKLAQQWSFIREQQRKLQDFANGITVVPTLDSEVLDGLHLTSASARRLGERAADAMFAMITGDRSQLFPEPESIIASWDEVIKAPTVEVTFKNVHGSLTSTANQVLGLLLHHPDGRVADGSIAYIELTGCKAIIHLVRWEYDTDPAAAYTVSFGGCDDPAITICDSDSRIPLGFGPLPISPARKKHTIQE